MSDKSWYVIHTYAGYENKVAANLEKRVESMEMQDKIFRVLVPMEKEMETKEGKQKIIMKKVFPGLRFGGDDHERRFLVCGPQYPRRDGVCGIRNKAGTPDQRRGHQDPAPDGYCRRKAESRFYRGETVQVKEGPFTNFVGKIEDINLEKGKLKVLVSMFGRETPVELEYYQVQKM
jgi:transcription termination/antitermination protein NusG